MLPNLSFSITESPVAKRLKVWRHVFKTPEISALKQASLTAHDHVFALGSCFANEIRAALEQGGITVHPTMDASLAELFVDEVKIAPRWGDWDERVHYQCFTPFTIRQEAEIALGSWRPSDDSIFECRIKGQKVFVDPYRRSVYARSRDDALEIRSRMDQRIREGIQKAEILVFTLGLVETFQLRHWGGYISEYNPALGEAQLDFVNADYDQIHSELNETMKLIRSAHPDKKVVFSVSPIPIARTFSDMDAISATMRAKSILRTCADSMTRTYENVIYWPSYEFAMWSGNAFCAEDGRHIRPEAVKQITSAFCRAFYSDSIARQIERATECSSNHGHESGQNPRRKKWRFPFRKAA
jgi:hypothetical protein